MLDSAVRRSDVKSVVLVCDSPGGDTSDLFPCASFIRSCRAAKPLAAISSDAAYSAAYALGSAASKLFVSSVGGIGSIGVWTVHACVQRALQSAGVDMTVVSSGTKKTQGNPYEALSVAGRAELQKTCDYLRALFVQCVAESRACSASALMATEAAAYTAGEGVPMLADAVAEFDEVMEYMTALGKGRTQMLGGPDYPEGSRPTLAAPAQLHLSAGRVQTDPQLLSFEDTAGGVTSYSALDLQRLMAHERGGALTKTAEQKLSMLTRLQTLKRVTRRR